MSKTFCSSAKLTEMCDGCHYALQVFCWHSSLQACCVQHCVAAAEEACHAQLLAEELEEMCEALLSNDQQPCRRPHTRSVSRQTASFVTQSDAMSKDSTATSPASKRRKVRYQRQTGQSDAVSKAAQRKRKRAGPEVTTTTEATRTGVSAETRCVKKRHTQPRDIAPPAQKNKLRRSARTTSRVDYNEQDADLDEVPIIPEFEALFPNVPRCKRSTRARKPRPTAAPDQEEEPWCPVVPRCRRSARARKPRSRRWRF